MLYVYRKSASNGARELAEAVDGRRYRALQRPIERRVGRGDVVICWGERLDPINNVRILNGAPIRNKYQDALTLTERGVPTITVSNQPRNEAAAVEDPALQLWTRAQQTAENFMNTDTRNLRSDVARRSVSDFTALLTDLSRSLQTPAPAAEQWLARRFNHVGGNDLLTRPPAPEYWSRKENLVEEYRIHSFCGKSIRAGQKVHREGVANPHPWIRSYDGGWKISYDGFQSRRDMRRLARTAVEALGLQFGAVDIGRKADGSLMVLEVNRAPGLEGGTVTAYAQAIERWMRGEFDEDED